MLDSLRKGAAIVCLWSFPWLGTLAAAQESKGHLLTLRSIYDEVKDMGSRPGENFIQWEFFIGAPDDDDTNKDISVIVFIQTVEGMETMKIQVTYLERTRENPKVKLAKMTKSLRAIVGADSIRIDRSDYDEGELARLTGDILKAVQAKKKLLRIKSAPSEENRCRAGFASPGLIFACFPERNSIRLVVLRRETVG